MNKVKWGWVMAACTAVAFEVVACAATSGRTAGGGASGSETFGPGGSFSSMGGSGGAFITETGATSSDNGNVFGSAGVVTRPMNMGNGPDGSCGELPFSAEQVTKTTTTTKEVPSPIDLYIMWDQSLSMTCPITSGSGGMGGMGGMPGTVAADRWDAVKSPLSSWVQAVPADP